MTVTIPNLPPIPDFKTQEERQQWILEHATYFTVVRWLRQQYHRADAPSLEVARKYAHAMLQADPTARLMIYAVYPPYDSWVENVMK